MLVQAEGGPLVAGALVALEGVFALVVPPLIGPLTDRMGGRRLPFVAGGAVLAVAGLVLVAAAGSFAGLVLGLVVFQIAYFACLTPYFALFGDVVGEEERGRSQSAQGALREVGLALAFVAGPAVLGLWRPAPFLLAALGFVAAVPPFVWVLARYRRPSGGRPPKGGRQPRSARHLLREQPAVRRFLTANALWETALSALRAFVVLFLTVGLGRSEGFASLVLAVVIAAALVGAPLAGWSADRLGRRRTVGVALAVYAVMAAPALTQSALLLPSCSSPRSGASWS